MNSSERRGYVSSGRNILQGILKNLINKPKYSFLFTVNRGWKDIVGEKYFDYTKVDKVVLLNENKNANLYITTYNSAVSFFMSNNKIYILDKINNLFGYRAVVDIFIKEVPTMVCKNKEEIYVYDREKIENFVQNNGAEDEKLRNSLNKLAEQLFKKKLL